jgi:hypothetical protein
MATLYLGTPDSRAKYGSRSFEEVQETRIGRAYALSKREAQTLKPGDNVVVLRKDRYQIRAEGKLRKIEFTGEITGNGLCRFNVYIDELTSVEYHSGPDLKHTGVLLVE